ncbi:hypothetical protein FHR71_003657 [Methylobacterium sp. RAS18]|nr:hypothetical protein [Methylobacterium sp. RAS18]
MSIDVVHLAWLDLNLIAAADVTQPIGPLRR